MPELDSRPIGSNLDQVRISGAVMGHPRRQESAKALIAQAPDGLLQLALDPDPDGPPTALRSAMTAWSAVTSEATHHLVLQDDAVPCAGFFDRVHEIVRAAPDAALAFFTSWNSRNGAAVRMGALLGARWVEATREYTPTVALVLPARLASGFADYARRHADGWPDDVVMQRYLRAHRVPTYLTVPNLVEHDDFPSVAGNDHHGLRRAACYGEAPRGADWRLSSGLADIDTVPFFKHGMAQCALRYGDDGRWTTVDSERYCGRLNFDLDRFRKQLHYTASESATLMAKLAPLRPKALEALWITAGLTGFLAQRAGGEPGHGSVGEHDRLTDAAIGTIGPGGLCGEVGAISLSRFHDALAELTRTGVELGAAAHHDASAHATNSAPAIAQERKRGAKGRLVITGVKGGLARYVAQDLAHQDYDVALLTGDREGLPGVTLPASTLRSAAELRQALRSAESIIHIGAMADARHVLALAERDIGHLVCVETGDDGTDEPAPTRPGSPTRPGTQPATTVLRTGVPYGPGILHGNSLMTTFVENALLRRPIRLESPAPDPLQYIHASDICRAIERVLLLRRSGLFEICNADVMSARDLAEAVCEAVRPVPVDVADQPTTRDARRARMTADKARAELGWQPVVTFHEGLWSFAQWLAYEADPYAL
ncbi:hypothetical protein [Streptomyces sp. KR80]|uniref:hypothetical protein n=1 Tax=Streptomyces sp. KR80 TaxID=3457426 RepID=UPI003FD596DD